MNTQAAIDDAKAIQARRQAEQAWRDKLVSGAALAQNMKVVEDELPALMKSVEWSMSMQSYVRPRNRFERW